MVIKSARTQEQRDRGSKVTTTMTTTSADQEAVFESVAELFSLLSTPVRLKIISALCNGEKNVSQLLEEIETTQPNMSRLSTLYRAGVLDARFDRSTTACRASASPRCAARSAQVAIEMAGHRGAARRRLLP
jgi:ArsR family transcriptional regulator